MVFACALVVQELLESWHTEDYTTSSKIWRPVIRAIITMQRLSCCQTHSAAALSLCREEICWSICLPNVVEISKERPQGYGEMSCCRHTLRRSGQNARWKPAHNLRLGDSIARVARKGWSCQITLCFCISFYHRHRCSHTSSATIYRTERRTTTTRTHSTLL